MLFLSRRPPFPQTGGAPIRTHRLLTGLARDFEVTFVTFDHDPASGEPDADRAALERLSDELEVVVLPGLRRPKRVAQALSVFRLGSWEWGRYATRELAATLRQLVREREPALVHFDDMGVAQARPAAGAVNVLSPHGVEHVITRENGRASGGVRRAFGELEWRKVAREERALWRRMDLTLALSEAEAATMRAGGASVALCPNGTDEVPFLPPPWRDPGEPVRVLFVGTGSFQPNERGIAWFVTEVMPRLREQMPVAFDVVGTPPNRPVEADGVVYRGRVPDLAPWYEQAHVVVVPLFEGAGTRLKVLEAAAYGRPMVSTGFGPEGLPLAPREHFLEADEAEAFAAAVAEVARMAEARAGELVEMLERARRSVEPLFWPEIIRRLLETYSDAIARHEAGAPA
jgi:glycosyltransferase involved in cell wall biosynthesis